MNYVRVIVVAVAVAVSSAVAQTAATSPSPNAATLPARMATPAPIRAFHAIIPDNCDRIGDCEKFIREVLAPSGVNVLVLEVGYRYQYKSWPNMGVPGSPGRDEIKLIVKACRESGIKLIPEFNCLGHQATCHGSLLGEYPQYQEKPGKRNRFLIDSEEELQSKKDASVSYCPLEPEVHSIIFALLDELVEVFETDTIHVGMDEVFDIASTNCPRCAGKDPSELFAGEVNALHDHLAGNGVKMWMWGDRLTLAGANGFKDIVTGQSYKDKGWETTLNGTERAVDLIPRDIVICDWHYERTVNTPEFFARKGFDVIPCSFWSQEVALKQVTMMRDLAASPEPAVAAHAKGVMLSNWVRMPYFIDAYYGRIPPVSEQKIDARNPSFPWKAAERCVGVFKAVTAMWRE